MTLETKTNNSPSRLVLKLNEENDVRFKLSIQGTVSNPEQTKVMTRFVVSENNTGISWMFPMEHREEDGLFVAIIPEMPSVFSENQEYTGKVEVIVGNRYFNPTNVGIAFERAVKVDASPILAENQKAANKEVEKAVESVIKPELKVESPKRSVQLPFDESNIQEVMFTKQQQPRRNPLPLSVVAERKAVKRPHDPAREKYKNKLKSLIAEAWKEID